MTHFSCTRVKIISVCIFFLFKDMIHKMVAGEIENKCHNFLKTMIKEVFNFFFLSGKHQTWEFVSGNLTSINSLLQTLQFRIATSEMSWFFIMLEIFLHCFGLPSLIVLVEMLRVCSSDVNIIFDVRCLRKFCKLSA